MSEITVKGVFETEVTIEVDLEKLKQGDVNTIEEAKRDIGEAAQEMIQWGETPFTVTESEFNCLKGPGF